MKKKLFPLLVFLVFVFVGQSQVQPNEQLRADLEVRQNEMFSSLSGGDKTAFAQLTGDDYITINADGTYMNKSEAVNQVVNFKGSTNKIIQKETRFYNNIAITTGRAKFYIKSLLVADIYFTQTWVRRDDKWLFIGWQGTMTGQPKNYPIYVSLLILFILFSAFSLIKFISRKKKTAANLKFGKQRAEGR